MSKRKCIPTPFDENDSNDPSYLLVMKHFKGNRIKTLTWFHTENPLFGNIEPCVLLALRPKKCLKVIQGMIEGNFA